MEFFKQKALLSFVFIGLFIKGLSAVCDYGISCHTFIKDLAKKNCQI